MPRRERIDRGGFVFVGDLDQAQFGPKGIFAHEFGVDADEFGLGEPGAQFGQRLGGGDQRMDMHRFFRFFPLSGRSTAPGRFARLDKGGGLGLLARAKSARGPVAPNAGAP